jgi:enoyl-CoA hydratase/carnithine racemase
MREMIAGAKPIVAAVEGYVYGASLALAAASDLRACKGLAAARTGTRLACVQPLPFFTASWKLSCRNRSFH